MNPGVRVLPSTAIALLLLGGTGCELFTGPVCTLEALSGVAVTVQDSLTGAPAASGAQLIVRDRAYADTVTVPPTSADPDRAILSAAEERPGIYTVTVRKAGFLPWERTNVLVTADECHVRTVMLVARLQPLS